MHPGKDRGFVLRRPCLHRSLRQPGYRSGNGKSGWCNLCLTPIAAVWCSPECSYLKGSVRRYPAASDSTEPKKKRWKNRRKLLVAYSYPPNVFSLYEASRLAGAKRICPEALRGQGGLGSRSRYYHRSFPAVLPEESVSRAVVYE